MAFLRAINVGGNRTVPMKELSALFTSLGARDVVTYIQSGNVVFTAPGPELDATRIAAAILERFGFEVPVVVRAHDELVRVQQGNPFLKRGVDRKLLHVAFLSAEPRSVALDPARYPKEETALVGADLFLHLPNGVGKSKLTVQYLDRALGVTATVRNWNTVEKLAALSA